MSAPITTTYHGGAAPRAVTKPFSWSYSRLKNYEACPKRHYHYDIAKDVKEPESEELKQGNLQHKFLAEFISHGKPIPDDYRAHLEPWAERIFMWKGTDVRDHGVKVDVELELAITAGFEPCPWFANGDAQRFNGVAAWYRAKIDVAWRLGPLGVLIDWKTGKIVEDSVQLILNAAAAFYHYPELKTIRTTFAWLKFDADTTVDVRRDELPKYWASLWSRIEALRLAHERTDYPPTPSYLCRRWCAVKSCPHHGESHG